jgi:hypothetical protein
MANANWNNVKHQASRRVQTAYQDVKDDGIFGIVALLILTIFIGLFCKVISINVSPYAIVFGDTLPTASGIPVIGWAWDVLNIMYLAMGSFVAWLIVNTGQCLWIFITLDRKVHRKVVSEMSAEHKLQGLEGRSDSADIRNMRRKGIKLPAAILTYSGWIALGCFVVEGIINFKAYPPVNDFGKFLVSIQLGRFEVFNVENIAKFLWSMFSTEIFVVVILLAFMWVDARKTATPEN